MKGKKRLIVNADDFGLSFGVNRGIIEAHHRGIVTSASLMVRWPSAIEAADYCREHSNLSLGLHVDLGEWIFKEEAWIPVYEVVPVNDTSAVEKEVSRQLEDFRRLLGRNPTHIDSHQHVHRREPAHSILVEIARKVGVPLRLCCPEVSYCGDFYGQTQEGSPLRDVISVEGLLKILAALPTGITELACHPGFGDDLATMYRSEREQEVKVLCDTRIQTALKQMEIELCSFNDVVTRSI